MTWHPRLIVAVLLAFALLTLAIAAEVCRRDPLAVLLPDATGWLARTAPLGIVPKAVLWLACGP